jgi:hypothetical protein
VIQLRWRVLPLVAWTFAVWVSRSRNVLTNDDLTAVGLSARLAVVGVFIALALIVFIGAVRGVDIKRSLGLLSIWSVGYWIIRGGDILLDSQWSLGFKTVHAALMLGTFALVTVAMWRPSTN